MQNKHPLTLKEKKFLIEEMIGLRYQNIEDITIISLPHENSIYISWLNTYIYHRDCVYYDLSKKDDSKYFAYDSNF